MKHDNDSSISTHASLLNRLRDLEDQASWQQFLDTYWLLIHSVAIKAGLTQVEAQEVVQETVISVARHLPAFRYDPKVCSFKTWMLRMTRWRIIDQFRMRLPVAQRLANTNQDDATATAELDRLSGGSVPELEAIWNQEWENAALTRAIEELKHQVSPEQFQMFDLYVLRKMPAGEVAALLGTSLARVYLTKHRLSKLLRRLIMDFDELAKKKRWISRRM